MNFLEFLNLFLKGSLNICIFPRAARFFFIFYTLQESHWIGWLLVPLPNLWGLKACSPPKPLLEGQPILDQARLVHSPLCNFGSCFFWTSCLFWRLCFLFFILWGFSYFLRLIYDNNFYMILLWILRRKIFWLSLWKQKPNKTDPKLLYKS